MHGNAARCGKIGPRSGHYQLAVSVARILWTYAYGVRFRPRMIHLVVVDIPAMSGAYHRHCEHRIQYFIDNAVVADPDPPCHVFPGELAGPSGARLVL